jgi:hypothetical protein
MFFAIAVLLIQPQVAPQFSFSAEKIALLQPANSEASPAANSSALSSAKVDEDFPEPAVVAPILVELNAPAEPVAASISEALPEAPVPAPLGSAPAPMAFVKPGKSMTVTAGELLAENRRNQFLWRGLVIASSGAATFDAWTTRHAIATSGAQELNPMLKPFAGNTSLYAAIQVGPALMDFAGRKMMYSRYSWVRHMWWVPQSASFVSSIFCGAHNLAFH